jgi:hypothetical protein
MCITKATTLPENARCWIPIKEVPKNAEAELVPLECHTVNYQLTEA